MELNAHQYFQEDKAFQMSFCPTNSFYCHIGQKAANAQILETRDYEFLLEKYIK